jgi:outer membrane autotransporter protein
MSLRLPSIINYKGTSKSRNRKQPVNTPSEKNSVWVAPFGSYVHLKEHGSIPKYNNQIAGALVACDHTGSNYLVGAGVGYAFNYISYGKGLGHGKVNEEMAVFYGSYLSEHLKLLGALWGGYYQFRNTPPHSFYNHIESKNKRLDFSSSI